MIENRIMLNKKKVCVLPDEVIIKEYVYSKDIKRYIEPKIIPTLCICNWGQGNIGKSRKPKQDAKQLWVKTQNKELIQFILNYNWRASIIDIGSPFLSSPKFKKIILEEFYGVKDDRK